MADLQTTRDMLSGKRKKEGGAGFIAAVAEQKASQQGQAYNPDKGVFEPPLSSKTGSAPVKKRGRAKTGPRSVLEAEYLGG